MRLQHFCELQKSIRLFLNPVNNWEGNLPQKHGPPLTCILDQLRGHGEWNNVIHVPGAVRGFQPRYPPYLLPLFGSLVAALRLLQSPKPER